MSDAHPQNAPDAPDAPDDSIPRPTLGVAESGHAPGRKANRLARESSAYLRQHQWNPVDWYPWGEEALLRAKELDRPLLVSIGYSACHWCHVMERESFEDAAIAARMNEAFVNVKVDREERPDVDQIYMDTALRLHGHGGWPLNVICTPDGRPFFVRHLPAARTPRRHARIPRRHRSRHGSLAEPPRQRSRTTPHRSPRRSPPGRMKARPIALDRTRSCRRRDS